MNITFETCFLLQFLVDQSCNQLSEDSGLTLLYVCASVLLGVSGKFCFHIF